MAPIDARKDDENAVIRGSSSTNLLQVPEEKSRVPKKWKSLTRIFSRNKSSPSLRQTLLAINIDAANRVPCDIDDLTDSDFTQSLSYSPELAEIVSSGERHKRWGLCLTSDGFTPDRSDRVGDRSTKTEEEVGRRPTTLYLILDPDQGPSLCSSEVMMLVGTMEELRGQTGGGDVLERGL